MTKILECVFSSIVFRNRLRIMIYRPIGISSGLLISIIAIDSDTIERYFCSIAIGIADTFMRQYRYRYRRYFFGCISLSIIGDTFEYRCRLLAILENIAKKNNITTSQCQKFKFTSLVCVTFTAFGPKQSQRHITIISKF
jgi:hypothetical protein